MIWLWMALLACRPGAEEALPCTPATGSTSIPAAEGTRLVPVFDSCPWVTDLRPFPADPQRLLLAHRTGELRTARTDRADTTVLATLPSEGGFMEFISVAIHPTDPQRLFLLYATGTPGEQLWTRLDEYRLTEGEQPTATFVQRLLQVEEPAVSHNGGRLQFGPDGKLYVPLGDGGDTDPAIKENARDPGKLLGKILRLDVDGAAPYAIPDDNPFLSVEGARPELWMKGLRMPWRMAFLGDGRLVIGDVGRDHREKLILGVPGGDGGWAFAEGTLAMTSPDDARAEVSRDELLSKGLQPPLHEYPHGDGPQGCILAGGEIVDPWLPQLKGRLLFGDFMSGDLWIGTVPSSSTEPLQDVRPLGRLGKQWLSADTTGSVLLSDIQTVHRLAPAP